MDYSKLDQRTEQSTSGGGYTAFRWAAKDWLTSIPLPDADNSALISNDYIFKPGYGWVFFQMQDKEFELNEESSGDGDGFETVLTGYAKGENINIRQFINDGETSVDGYALIDNCNEISTLSFGKGKCCPAELKIKFASGKKSSDKKGFEFTIKVEQNGVNCMYEGVGAMDASFPVAADDATPDISAGTGTYVLPENAEINEITGLDNAVIGSLITLRWNSTTNHSTITSGTTFQLAGSFTPATGAVLVLQATTATTFAERFRNIPV